MEAVETVFCDLVQRFRLWLPRRVETQVMSRDFWMPDQSCRVCYECDTPFSLFNRRHHCRICGRVFCGKCTQNTLPIIDSQTGLCHESERVRACNFCFKLKQEECKRDTIQNVVKPSTPSLTPSSSSFSLSSSGTSTSGHSTSSTFSSGNPNQVSVAYGYKTPATDRIDPIAERKQRRPMRTGRKIHRSQSPKGRELSPNPYDFCSNRSDDDETDDAKEGLYQTTRIFDVQSQDEEDDDGCIEIKIALADNKQTPCDFSGNSTPYINKVTSTDDEIRCEEVSLGMEKSPHVERSLSRRSMLSSDDYEGPEESVDESNFYTPSLVHDSTPAVGEEFVDVENNEAIWVPPPPEDEAEEMAMSMVDDDDDGDNESGWGSLSNSEYRIREKATASQEQRRAMRAVVDGHFRALVGQLLDGEGLVGDEYEKDGWLETVTSVASQAASLLKPDTSKDGGMDPGGYVKVKCIASGQRSESCVIKGVVCKKNVAHRRMTPKFKNPRLLLLGGALEYQRVPNQLSSLDTLLHQEKDHLSMTASRIEAHHPNVVLVEKTVSRQAQERLLSKEISLVLNVKRPLLERIARCTGAEIVPAPDQIIKARLGHCDFFHVEKFVEDLGSAGQAGKLLTKTLMFFDGCPRPLGCTVLLRGANGDELKKVKRVVQFAVFAAYQLALETSFLVDEGATVPDLSFKSPISVALPDKPSKLDRSITTVPGFLLPAPGPTTCPEPQQNRAFSTISNMPSSMNTPHWSDVHRKPSSSMVSAPWSVTSSCFSSRNNSPNVSPRAADSHDPSRRMFGPLQAHNINSSLVLPTTRGPTGSADQKIASSSHSTIYNASIGLQNLTSMYRSGMKSSSASLNQLEFAEAEGSGIVTRMLKVNSELEIGHGSDLTTSEAQSGLLWEDQEANHEEFPPSPSDHQSILVSFSSSCLRKATVCERGHLFRIKYYGSFDKPLGKFLKDNVFDLHNVCGFCEETRDAHLHCYMHRQGSLAISVRHKNQVLSGEREGKIWMWHRCLKCPRVNKVPPATNRLLMSDAAWGLSFGKFLELSFSNHAAASRIAACGHSLHRDCLRFYGFGSMVACFRYAPINVHSVYLPPSKLEFNHPELDEWLRNEIGEVTDKGKLIFAKAFNTLREIEEKVATSGISKAPEARRRIAEYEATLIRDQKAFLDTLQKAAPMRKEACDLFGDILEINSTRRGLAALSLVWSQRIQVLQASLKLNKAVPTSRSANLDDPSILLGIKDKRPFEAQEARSTPMGDTTVVQKLVVAYVNETMGETSIKAQDTFSNSLTAVVELQKSEVAHTNELTSNSGDSPRNVLSGGEDAKQNFEFSAELEPRNDLAPPNLVLRDQNIDMTELPASVEIVEDLNKLHSRPLLIADNLPSVEGRTDLKMGEENCSFYSHVLEEDDLLVRRTLSEGQFPVLPDLSDTFEAAWTGKGHTVEAHEVSISSTGQEIASQGSGIGSSVMVDEPVSAQTVETVSEVDKDPVSNLTALVPSLYEEAMSGSEGVVACTASSALKSEASEDLGLVDTPFSNLYRAYNKGFQYPLNGSPGLGSQWLYTSYTMMLPIGEGRIFLPLGIHDTVIPVYDDEPTSIIAYAITSHQYQAHLSDGPSERERLRETERESDGKRDFKERDLDSLPTESVVFHPLQVMESSPDQSETTPRDKTLLADEMPNTVSRESSNLQYSKATHVKVSFTDTDPQGRVKYMVTCYYAKQFDALRKTCCSDQMDFIRSLCRCKKWGAQGGKSNVFFAKTRDDRFVIKQVTKTELESFIKFAPEYFKYISESLKSGSPTCLAKILGIFQVTIKHGKVGKEVRMDLMAMENLLYGRHVTRLYDLKGSLRSRYNADTTGKNKVLLDQNLLESMLSNPIYIGNKAKRILERAVWNDTSFLASADVMDYSLLVGVDEERRELVLGIIDFMRQYTWDKHLETWVKASGILGGPKNATPTVISPKQYKKRFRKAMKNYFLMVPDQWSPAAEIFGPPHVDSVESFQSTS
ncbi:hypothetical protein GOP47_0029658 [Adiantum capillus-veneris]|nr:hypothetical protein GOP47_0029316 [Adiantum capillus-veneris]KAI5056137.1 hypothetical protein GOP47_0029658 [Adiantum capillus-veneris]